MNQHLSFLVKFWSCKCEISFSSSIWNTYRRDYRGNGCSRLLSKRYYCKRKNKIQHLLIDIIFMLVQFYFQIVENDDRVFRVFKSFEFPTTTSACFLNKRFKKSSLFPIPHLDVFKWAVRYEHNDGFRWAARWPFSCSLGLSNSYLREVFWFVYDSCKTLAHEVSLYFSSAWVVFS